MRLLTLLALICFLAAGCGPDDPVTAPMLTSEPWETGFSSTVVHPDAMDHPVKKRPDVPTLEERVIQNCYAVRDAAEAWSVENGGLYPNSLCDTTPLGHTLIDFLPDGMLLHNPSHFCRTEPVDGVASTEGQTGYVPMIIDQKSVGYLITGVGGTAGTNIIDILKDPRLEDPEEGNGKNVRNLKM